MSVMRLENCFVTFGMHKDLAMIEISVDDEPEEASTLFS